MADHIASFEDDKYIIKIDQSKCISCGSCSALAPNIFELNERFLAKVKDNPKINKEDLINAAASCPVNAITIIDKSSGKKL